MNITADQLHDARQCDELYIRMFYLVTLLDDWAMVDPRYHRFAQEQIATREAIQAKLDALKPVALQLNSSRDELLQSMLPYPRYRAYSAQNSSRWCDFLSEIIGAYYSNSFQSLASIFARRATAE
jgi:hypothetical protein